VEEEGFPQRKIGAAFTLAVVFSSSCHFGLSYGAALWILDYGETNTVSLLSLVTHRSSVFRGSTVMQAVNAGSKVKMPTSGILLTAFD
jgi:hypothetical protein